MDSYGLALQDLRMSISVFKHFVSFIVIGYNGQHFCYLPIIHQALFTRIGCSFICCYQSSLGILFPVSTLNPG